MKAINQYMLNIPYHSWRNRYHLAIVLLFILMILTYVTSIFVAVYALYAYIVLGVLFIVGVYLIWINGERDRLGRNTGNK